MVDDPKDFRWNSYPVYAFGRKETLVDEHPIYEQLGTEGKERQQKYQQYIKVILQAKKAIKGEVERRQVYGDASFAATISRTFQLSAVINRRGRPKKGADNGRRTDK
jgi:hypothetical protein